VKIKFDDLGPDDPKPLIQNLRVVDLTPPQLARCRELSFGDDGYMCEDLDEILREENRWRYRYSRAILLGPPPAKPQITQSAWPILGWALLQPLYRRSKYSAQFFVDPLHRGKGYGKLLLEEAAGYSFAPVVYVDDDNKGFFNKYPFLLEQVRDKDMSA